MFRHHATLHSIQSLQELLLASCGHPTPAHSLEKLDIPTNKAVFDLSTQPAGIYFIEISNGDQIERNKVIKI